MIIPLFYAAEIGLLRSSDGATDRLFASDAGYRTLATDPSGVVAYPPLLARAFSMERRLNLDPNDSSVGAAWGMLTLNNVNGIFNSRFPDWDTLGQAIRVLYGTKGFDTGRQYLTDPGYGTLAPAFIGTGGAWFLSDTELQIPLRDATILLDSPVQQDTYDGSGGYGGTSDLAGKPKPYARGGTNSLPISNVTPTLLDPTNLIYQYNDGPGTVVALYVGAASTFTFQADTTNLYSGTTNSGQYRTDNSRGLFQLGSTPIRAVTCDVTGSFAGTVVSTAIAMVQHILSDDAGVPGANIGSSAFAAADSAFNYTAGIYFGSDETPSVNDAIAQVLSSLGAQLVPFRDGTLAPIVLRAPANSGAVASFDLSNVVSVVPKALPDALTPPSKYIRVNYQKNYTRQTTDLNTGSATAGHLQFVASESRYRVNASAPPTPSINDLKPIGGALLNSAHAGGVANQLSQLWGKPRYLYEVTMPVSLAVPRDFNDLVKLTWPNGVLAGGKNGLVVGDVLNAGESTMVLEVLV